MTKYLLNLLYSCLIFGSFTLTNVQNVALEVEIKAHI